MLFLSDDPKVVERAGATGRPAIAGNVDQVKEIVQRYIDVGVDEIIIPDFNLGRTAADKMEAADRFMNDVGSTFR